MFCEKLHAQREFPENKITANYSFTIPDNRNKGFEVKSIVVSKEL